MCLLIVNSKRKNIFLVGFMSVSNYDGHGVHCIIEQCYKVRYLELNPESRNDSSDWCSWLHERDNIVVVSDSDNSQVAQTFFSIEISMSKLISANIKVTPALAADVNSIQLLSSAGEICIWRLSSRQNSAPRYNNHHGGRKSGNIGKRDS